MESADEREYSLSGMLSTNPDDLEPGEMFLRLDQWRAFRRLFRSWESRKLSITLKIYRYLRSLAQNNYYWGVAVPTIRAWMLENWGVKYTPNRVHSYNLMHVLGDEPEFTEVAGVQVVSFERKSTSKMSTVEFSQFVEDLQRHYDTRGCYIPNPKKKGLNLLNEFIDDL
ncbi:hypothetical protein UFOVP1492_72 [uncultured Caudovirales phage]|uniref:Uncharacterized protein n=1 Tax=uncultured Caudovirales phage TaxID=2100421 RepID=A0A6J5REY4_9CAUD|nr:hypothetical protein UFOVP1127_62 [uncultured Caudovirales phage]CAB4193036.1 hypothetical protein UFOVP1242_12 [uncultured Caudovirales phage]CAB4217721.1 hypothetical protein UFOVP1492_72 [uncultured Caudovirales phage]CAB5231540.1 hypothetical protein UFOVP1580_101 [uncultured Caudovirales phage]